MRTDLIVFYAAGGLVLAASLALFAIFVSLFDPAGFVAFLRATKERAQWLRARMRRGREHATALGGELLLDVFEDEVRR